MKILITGGCGFIGTNIALEALKRGHFVRCFDNLRRKGSNDNKKFLERQGVRVTVGDITHPPTFPKYDGIIHLAGNPGVPWSIENPLDDCHNNLFGTLNMLEVAKKNKTPFLFASTNKVYPNSVTSKPISESFSIDAASRYHHSPYGVSKLAAEQYVQEYFHTYGVPTVVNRMSCIYGLYQKGVEDQGWIDWFVRQIGFGDGKLNIYGDGTQIRDMLFGEDVARLYLDELESIDKVKGQVFNVGGGVANVLSLNQAIAYIEKLSAKKAKITYKDWRIADQRVYISDIGKVNKMLGWKPRIDPKEGVKRMYDQYRSSH